MKPFLFFLLSALAGTAILGSDLFVLSYLVIATVATVYGLAEAVRKQRRWERAGKERIAMARVVIR